MAQQWRPMRLGVAWGYKGCRSDSVAVPQGQACLGSEGGQGTTLDWSQARAPVEI